MTVPSGFSDGTCATASCWYGSKGSPSDSTGVSPSASRIARSLRSMSHMPSTHAESCRPSLTLHDTNEIAHERSHEPHRTDRAGVIHPRRTEDSDEPDGLAGRPIATDDEAAVAEGLKPVLPSDRHMDLAVAECE